MWTFYSQRKRATVLPKHDRHRLDRLIGAALLSDDLCQRLIRQRDTAIFDEYSLSITSQAWLRAVQAASVEDLAEAILSAQHRPLS